MRRVATARTPACVFAGVYFVRSMGWLSGLHLGFPLNFKAGRLKHLGNYFFGVRVT